MYYVYWYDMYPVNVYAWTNVNYYDDSIVNQWCPGMCGCDSECVNFKLNLGINVFSTQVKITLEWTQRIILMVSQHR